jgi:hypothetical protein
MDYTGSAREAYCIHINIEDCKIFCKCMSDVTGLTSMHIAKTQISSFTMKDYCLPFNHLSITSISQHIMQIKLCKSKKPSTKILALEYLTGYLGSPEPHPWLVQQSGPSKSRYTILCNNAAGYVSRPYKNTYRFMHCSKRSMDRTEITVISVYTVERTATIKKPIIKTT